MLEVLVELGLVDELVGKAGGDEVELLQEVEERVLLPLRVLEPRVRGSGFTAGSTGSPAMAFSDFDQRSM